MIDPRTTNIVGQRVAIARRGANPIEVLGHGVVRVIDYQGGCFAFLIEAVGEIDRFGVGDGGLFQVTTFDESIEVVVDRELVESRSEESAR
jgi:hypothetical protein